MCGQMQSMSVDHEATTIVSLNDGHHISPEQSIVRACVCVCNVCVCVDNFPYVCKLHQ